MTTFQVNQTGPSILGPLEKSKIESPISKLPTPRRWISANISFPASGYSSDRRVPVTVRQLGKDGKPHVVTVAYAMGKNRNEAIHRANVICEAVNQLREVTL